MSAESKSHVPAPLLPRPVEVSAIPADGTGRQIETTPAERAAIAAEFGLLEIRSLSGSVELRRNRRDAIAVTGRVAAEIVQACVVSLEPVPQTIDEEFFLRLIPERDATRPSAGAEIVVDALADGPPDIYSGATIDVGAILLEHFALAIEPYPRAPGAEFSAEGTTDGEAVSDSPFAALGDLARRSAKT